MSVVPVRPLSPLGLLGRLELSWSILALQRSGEGEVLKGSERLVYFQRLHMKLKEMIRH